MSNTIQQRVMTVLSLVLGEHESNLKPTQRLRDDLAVDSLDFAEIMVEAEHEFRIDIDEDECAKCETVQQLVNHIADLCAPCSADVSTCTTHHHACDCRERKFAVLNKAALDCAMELDWLKNECGLTQEKCDTMTFIISRVHAAIDALHPGEDDLERARRLIDAAGLTGCADDASAGPGWSAVESGVAA